MYICSHNGGYYILCALWCLWWASLAKVPRYAPIITKTPPTANWLDILSPKIKTAKTSKYKQTFEKIPMDIWIEFLEVCLQIHKANKELKAKPITDKDLEPETKETVIATSTVPTEKKPKKPAKKKVESVQDVPDDALM